MRLHARADEPATLHPVIDPDICIGSGACVRACPEERALVLVGGRAHLAQASGCVGHGACMSACPVDAISLVFGSARRGVDLPELDHNFHTSQAGVYIAGELGGMGLIATAVRQGVKSVDAIVQSLHTEGALDADAVPLLIIGAGPAGIAASLQARKLGVTARIVEKATSLGGAVRTYPRGKIVMTSPAELPLYGRVQLRRTSKQALIELWEDVLAKGQVAIEFGVTVEGLARVGRVLEVRTSAGVIAARRVLFATGRRGRPRRLGVPGEERAHVHHLIEEPEEHDRQRCVVVGGGDVAAEAALALVDRPGTTVALVHRGARFDRCKPDNQTRLADAERAGQLTILRDSVIDRIEPVDVVVTAAGTPRVVPADAVFVLIGAELQADLLANAGIQVRTYRGDAIARR